MLGLRRLSNNINTCSLSNIKKVEYVWWVVYFCCCVLSFCVLLKYFIGVYVADINYLLLILNNKIRTIYVI